MHRLFVGVRPPPVIRDILIDAMDEGPELRWQSDEQLHLTLRFIGEIDHHRAEDVAEALGRLRFQPFELRLSGLGSFDHVGGGSVWAGVEPREEIAALAAKVERACVAAGIPPETRAFRPHITIARLSRRQSQAGRVFLAGRSLPNAGFTVDCLILFESRLSRHGAHYEAVADYPALPAQ